MCIRDSNRYVYNINALNYTPTIPLKYLFDNGFYYLWSVRANDTEQYGAFAAYRTINISAVIVASLPVSSVNFGNLGYLGFNDTTANNPFPFTIQNDGNAFVNITIAATSLWQSISNPNQYYKFKTRNSTEVPSFNFAKSITGFSIMPLYNVSSNMSIVELNWSDETDSAYTDIYVETPLDEEPGARNSTVYFTSYLAE